MTKDTRVSTSLIAFLSDASALEEGLCLGRVGVWRWRIGSEQLDWTRNLESVHHLPPGSFDRTLINYPALDR